MKKIIVYDTSYGSFNMGDYIINEAATKELSYLLDMNFVVRIGTHNPVCHFYQLVRRKRMTMNYIDNCDYKLLIGTNILRQNMIHPWPDWNINIFNYHPYKDTVLVGCGFNGDPSKTNLYTDILYKRILNKNMIHSTRDEKTKKYLESIGLKAINTGCPTLWELDSNFCKNIPAKKSKDVVFTLTDYKKDFINDQKLIDTLVNEYNEKYIWIQGTDDYEYFKTFKNIDNIKIINPNIESYSDFLNNHDVDYVGTRLHAGIYAIRHKKRAIILSVDNRANDMAETYNLNVIDRADIEKIKDKINSEFKTEIMIDEEAIKKWKSQFVNR